MALPFSVKRKTRKSSSLSPEYKLLKDIDEELSSHEESAIEAESDLLEMSAMDAEEGDQHKMDIILNKLEKLDLMATNTAAQIHSL